MRDPDKELRREFIQLFQKNKVPLTPEGGAVIKFFLDSDHHLSREDIRETLRERGTDVSLETVGEVMNLLRDYGFAREVTFKDGTAKYEHHHLQLHHDHFFCHRCEKIIEFSDDELESMQNDVARSHGFHVFTHQLNLYGLCRECYGEDEHTPRPLSAMLPDCEVVIAKMDVSSMGHKRRIIELGLRQGKRLHVISNNPGLMVVSIDGNRVALPRGMARSILVKLDVR